MKRPAAAQRRIALVAAAAAILAFPSCRRTEPPLTGAATRSAEVRRVLARAAETSQRGDWVHTEEFLRQAHAGAPDDPDIALDLGDTLIRLGRSEAARTHYRAFLSRHPSASQVRLALGLTLITLGLWNEAAGELERAVTERPRDPSALLNLGSVLSRLGRDEDAVARLRAAERLSPEDPAIALGLGTAYERLGRIPEAIAELERAVARDPDNVPALFTLGHCYARAGRRKEAQDALARFTRASQRKEAFLDEKRLFRAAQAKANQFSRDGQDQKALDELLLYRRELEAFPPFQQELGLALLRLGRRQEARAALERAVSLDPSLLEAHGHLAVLYQEAGESEKAMKERRATEGRVAYPPQSASPR
jgi:tetratricopeptide (TPR) repeat protein